MAEPFFILTLDGGGSKGVYTLGVLQEVEKLLGCRLHAKFQLIYGTSTGSIIAALLAMGKSVEDIHTEYFKLIPKIMPKWTRRRKTKALIACVEDIFKEATFENLKTDIGIVSTHVDYARPMIFKSSIKLAYGRKASWKPGFGCKVSDAVLASSAAFPYFNKHKVVTTNQGEPVLLDGGFVANNPAMLAIADAVKALGIPKDNIRVLSVGVGSYREPRRMFIMEFIQSFWPFWLVRKTLDCNTNTTEILRGILCNDVKCVRISDNFAEKDYETDLLEYDVEKLKKICALGRESFGKQEAQIRELLTGEITNAST